MKWGINTVTNWNLKALAWFFIIALHKNSLVDRPFTILSWSHKKVIKVPVFWKIRNRADFFRKLLAVVGRIRHSFLAANLCTQYNKQFLLVWWSNPFFWHCLHRAHSSLYRSRSRKHSNFLRYRCMQSHAIIFSSIRWSSQLR